MPIDREKALAATFPEGEDSYDNDDVILYHLGIGAGVPPTEPRELEYTYEQRLKVLPTFAVVAHTGARGDILSVPGLEFSPYNEMLYGIQPSKDVKLSNIARTLKEKQSLIKTEDRLSRNLDDYDFTEGINEEICRLAAPKITDDMVIAIDPGDIRKRYAKKMEFLGKVYDGSENEVGDGYPICKVVATDIESKKIIPLYCEAYSHKADDIKSENTQFIKAIETIMRHLGEKGIHAMDRGGDRGRFYKYYLERDTPIRFVIRLRDRDVLHKGKRKNCTDMALCLPAPHETVLIIYEDGKEKRRRVQYNAVPVRLPGYLHRLYFVVVKGFLG